MCSSDLEEVVEHRDGEKEVFSSDGLIAPLPESVGLSHKKEGSGGEYLFLAIPVLYYLLRAVLKDYLAD